MNREDIIKLARESYERGQFDLMESCKEAAVKAIEVAILAEREACANIVKAECIGFKDDDEQLNRIATAIRARGQA